MRRPSEPSLTFGVGMNPGRGAVDLQRAAVEHFGETGSHLKGQAVGSQEDTRVPGVARI